VLTLGDRRRIKLIFTDALRTSAHPTIGAILSPESANYLEIKMKDVKISIAKQLDLEYKSLFLYPKNYLICLLSTRNIRS